MSPSSVPYNPTEVTPEAGVPDASIRSQASPQDFGSQIGQANEKAGEVTEDLGVKYLQMATEAKAENTIANQFVPAAAQLKANYMQNKGMDAVRAQPQYLASVQNLRNQFIGNSNSPYETQILSSYMERHAMQETDFSSMYAEQQQAQYEGETHKAMLDTYSNSAAMNYNNPAIIDQNIKASDALTLKRGLDLGQDQQTAIPYTQSQNRGAIVKNIIESAISNGDTPAAINVFNTYKGTMSAQDTRQIEAALAPKVSDHDSRALSEYVLGQHAQQYNEIAYGTPSSAPQGELNGNPGMSLPTGSNKPIPGLGGLTGAQVPPVSPQEMGQSTEAPVHAPIDTNGKALPSIGDYYKANYNNILDEARQEAAKMRPNDIDFIEKTEARTKQQMDTRIEGEKKANEANLDVVTKAANGDFTKGTQPTTIDQLTNLNPQTKAAWTQLEQNDPKAAAVIANKMVGSKSDGKMGSGFSYLQQEAYKGNLSVNDLLYHVGDDLTQDGFKALHEISAVKSNDVMSPEDRSDNDSMATFLKYGHDRILHSSLFGNTHEAEQQYQAWFSSVSKQIQDSQSGESKVPLASLLDKNSKDYVGGNIDQFLIPAQKQLQDRAIRINGVRATINNVQPRLPNETPEEYLARVK